MARAARIPRRAATVALARAAALALALVAAVAVGGCGGGSGSADGRSPLVEVKPADRKPAPDLTGELLDGSGQFDPATARGQVLVVNFWASWCNPCRAEAADLEAVHQATKAKGVTFLGIDIRDDRDKARAFVRGRTSYPSVFDQPGRLSLDFDVPPNTIPATLVIDRAGRLAVVIRTAVRKSDLQPIVERIAAEPDDG
jgi:thiol-disulfide isomerase/thioredoxin